MVYSFRANSPGTLSKATMNEPAPNLARLLAKPFPQEESITETIAIVIGISLFVAFFLYLFQPFGLHLLKSQRFLIALGFGSMTLLASLVFDFTFIYVLGFDRKKPGFTFGQWILYMAGILLLISLANFLFVRWVVFGHLDWSLFPAMVGGTLGVGIFPVAILGALALLRQERKYEAISAEINEQAKTSAGEPDGPGVSIFDIPVPRIRYVEALQNYVKIVHLNDQDELAEQVERGTLKNVQDESKETSLVRCHRSYLVNRTQVQSTSGNAQGLLLTLAGCEKKVPVSRSYVPVFRAT